MPYQHLWDQHSSEISSKASKFLDAWLPLQELDFLHLGFLRKLHTKVWFGFSTVFWKPNSETQKVQKKADCWTCMRWQNTRSVGEMLDELVVNTLI